MKSSLLAILFMTTNVWALTVHDRDIHGKTNLTTTAVRTVKGKKITILVDKDGFSLYTFDEDKANVSNCSGGCLTEWPPQHAPAGSQVDSPYATIKGNDGQPQLILQGLPLYHYGDDKQPGDTFGEYPEWHVIEVIN